MTLPLFSSEPLQALKLPELRDYQSAAIETLRKRFNAGTKRMLVVAPIASGKSFIIANLIKSSTVPVLFVAHRMELIDQCVRELQRLGIHRIGVMRGQDERTDPNTTVQVASIQTLARRDKPKAGIVLCDEAHRVMGDQFQEHIFDHYGKPRTESGIHSTGIEIPPAVIIGFTASPTRLDGRPLGNSFETLDVVATYAELIKAGYVIEPDLYGAEVPIDLSQISIVAGDYNEGQLANRMNRKELIGSIVDHWLRLARYREAPHSLESDFKKTFCFAVNLDHSKAIVARFVEKGIRAAHLDGTTPEDERREMLLKLDSGELQVVSSCNVLLEGVDLPSAKCVIHARPTKSLVLWIQSCGRIGRSWCSVCRRPCSIHPSVKPIIIDHAKNFDEHGSPFEDRHWSLTQRATRMTSVPPMKICRQCFAYVLAGRFTCPHCKTEFPTPPPQGPPKESPETLVKRSLDPEELKRALFDKMVALARSRGYKPGFAGAKFKEHYGSWPPRAWSDEVTGKFAGDLSWQVGVDRRAEMKREIRENPAMDVGSDPAGLGGEDSEEVLERELEETEESLEKTPFADWLEEEGIR
jgi:DNA repair protein RadD